MHVSQTIKFNETTSGGNLASYCQTNYAYDSDASLDGHHWLKQMTTTWNWNSAPAGQPPVWNQKTLSQNVYTMDTAGQRLTNAVTDNTGTTRTEQYGYDELNRLTSVNYGDGQTQGYSFDPMGNRLQKADSVTGTENYGYNNANMLLTRGVNNYTNDADGNTLTGGGRTSSWDSQNRMVQCVDGSNTSTYAYGADGLRRRSTVNGVTTDFALDGDSVVREMRAGTPYATYLTGASGPMYKLQNTNGTIRWYFFDGLGSVLGEVDPSGNVTTYAKYDVYGGVRSRTGTATSAHGFVGALGHTSETETSLIYMRARYMDPVTGRFMSEDPSHQGPSWFSYAGSSPTCGVDSDGRSYASTAIEYSLACIAWTALSMATFPESLAFSGIFMSIAFALAAGAVMNFYYALGGMSIDGAHKAVALAMSSIMGGGVGSAVDAAFKAYLKSIGQADSVLSAFCGKIGSTMIGLMFTDALSIAVACAMVELN